MHSVLYYPIVLIVVDACNCINDMLLIWHVLGMRYQQNRQYSDYS